MRILIANRGEIAHRIARTLTHLGHTPILIRDTYDTVDPIYPSYCVGEPRQVYDNVEVILHAAKALKCQAVHPGYGFLSEDPTLAEKCNQEGLIFIGPNAENLKRFGDKKRAKLLAQARGLPVIPTTLEKFPLMAKAINGGGGRGNHIINTKEELGQYNQSDYIFEAFLPNARHLEVQLIVDDEKVIPLGIRDCTHQVNYQKFLEYTVPEDPRLIDIATQLMTGLGYKGLATVEFLQEENGKVYFMEVNPRIQVEHTITEQLYQTDLVYHQLVLAGIEPPLNYYHQFKPKGHHVQARLNAKVSGPLNLILPETTLRIDCGANDDVSPYYDPLVAKIISSGNTLQQAMERLYHYLNSVEVKPNTTNLELLLTTLEKNLLDI